MEKLKAKLSGAAPPKSPKPKSRDGTRSLRSPNSSPFSTESLPPPSPQKESGPFQSFPTATEEASPESKGERSVKRLKARIKACKQEVRLHEEQRDERRLGRTVYRIPIQLITSHLSLRSSQRSTSIQSRLDIRSPMIDEDVKWADKRVSQHEVECARIKIICKRAKSTLVSSILVDNGKLRMPAQNLLKTLTQRMGDAKRDLAVEQDRVREEELTSGVHGKKVEEALQIKLKRAETAGVGVGFISDDDEEDNDSKIGSANEELRGGSRVGGGGGG